jgi:membrane protease YdiL (CAAX protease family)
VRSRGGKPRAEPVSGTEVELIREVELVLDDDKQLFTSAIELNRGDRYHLVVDREGKLDRILVPHVPFVQNLRLLCYSYLIVLVLGGVACLGIRAMIPSTPLLPPQRLRAVPWSGLHIVSAFVLGVLPAAFFSNFVDLISTLALGHAVGSFVVLVYFGAVCEAQFYQLGMTTHRWLNNLVLGFSVWAVLTPVVWAVYLLVLLYYPLEEMALARWLHQHPGLIWEMYLVFVVTLVGPLFEELLFRGALQQWLITQPQFADVLLIFTVVMAVIYSGSQGWHGPVLYLVAVAIGYPAFERLMDPWLPLPGSARAVFVTSLIFAAIHSSQWPNPIPLFFLSLGLGFVACRTQSIVPAYVIHALFNLTTGLMILFGGTKG